MTEPPIAPTGLADGLEVGSPRPGHPDFAPTDWVPRATSLAGVIEAKLHKSATLVEGKGGVFEVKRGGKLLYSKKATGRFPENEEIVELLSQ